MSEPSPAIERWFTYHPPSGDEPQRYEAIRAKAKELAYLIHAACPNSSDRANAIFALREAVMWANASIAARPPDEEAPEAFRMGDWQPDE